MTSITRPKPAPGAVQPIGANVTSATDDYWRDMALIGGDRPAMLPVPSIAVTILNDVEPLDTQFGVAKVLTVPAMLQAPLFDQPEVEKGNRAQPPLGTYAILDAAKVPGLPESIESCGLEHLCLFKGNAGVELRDVAPWIVRLEEGNRFARSLFTRSDMPWHLWDNVPGIYLRSRTDLHGLWRHFRKFTKVQDDADTWFYLRFWEPDVLLDLASSLDPANARDFFSDMRFISHDSAGTAYIIERAAS